MLLNLLNHLADGDGWDTVIGVPVGEKTVTTATQPLTEAGWKHTLTGHGIRGTSPDGQASVRFDPLTAQAPQNPATWTIWAGPGGPAHLGHHRVLAHPELAAGRPLRISRPRDGHAPASAGPRAQDPPRSQCTGDSGGHVRPPRQPFTLIIARRTSGAR